MGNRRRTDRGVAARGRRLARPVREVLRGWCGSRTWAVIFMLSLTALAAGLTTALRIGSDLTVRVGTVAAVLWTAYLVVVVVRRKVSNGEIVVLVAATQALTTLSGVGFGPGILQAQAVVGLLAVVLVSSMFFPPRGIVLSGAGCLTGILVIVGTGPWSPEVKVAAALEISGIVVATVTTVTVLVGRLIRARRAAEAMAGADQLTGLLNRRGMHDGVAAVVEAARRDRHLVALVSADVDHFKRVNDTHGHAVGDDVLVAVARTIGRVTRADGLLVRLGGEELAWIATFPRPVDADRAAERVRAAVESTVTPGLPEVTVSVGVACAAPGDHVDADALLSTLLAEADRAMYEAKRTGRNRVVGAGAGAPDTVPTGLAAVTARALAGKVTPGSRTMRRPSLDGGGTVR